MLVKIHNAHDFARSLPMERYKTKHDFKIDPPKGEAVHNRRARMRNIGASRAGAKLHNSLRRVATEIKRI
jgi:hypothetical protein